MLLSARWGRRQRRRGTPGSPTVEELDCLVYGMAAAEERLTAAERVWYRSPKVLGFAVLGLTVLASVFFI